MGETGLNGSTFLLLNKNLSPSYSILLPLKNTMVMKTIKVSDPSVAEEIRKQMTTATSQEKGLMPVITGKSPIQRYIELESGEEIIFNYNYGILSLYSVQYGFSAIILLGPGSLNIVSGINTSPYLSTIKDTENKINVYKKSENETVIQNNRESQFRFYVSNL